MDLPSLPNFCPLSLLPLYLTFTPERTFSCVLSAIRRHAEVLRPPTNCWCLLVLIRIFLVLTPLVVWAVLWGCLPSNSKNRDALPVKELGQLTGFFFGPTLEWERHIV